MKRTRVLVPAAMIATLALAASAPASTSHGAVVKLRNTDHGQILAGRTGRLLYLFAPDKRNKDVCLKKTACTREWPPLTTKGTPAAKNGVNASELGTITLPNGKKQVTYFGHPLYNWIHDVGDGDTAAIGLNNTGGKWWGITASCKVVK
jgi:predicted lipoprotein with Yx(FWY)xxD motif